MNARWREREDPWNARSPERNGDGVSPTARNPGGTARDSKVAESRMRGARCASTNPGSSQEFTVMSVKVAWPLSYNIIRGRSVNNTFGMVRKHANGTAKPHQGWDLEASSGTSCFAIADGKVEFVKLNVGDYGTQVCCSFDFDGKTLYAYYAHLSRVDVTEGDSMSQGDLIGATGNTGNAATLPTSEDHLHFEIRTKKICGLGLAGRISPMKVYGTCPLTSAAIQNLSNSMSLTANDLRCMP